MKASGDGDVSEFEASLINKGLEAWTKGRGEKKAKKATEDKSTGSGALKLLGNVAKFTGAVVNNFLKDE